MPNDSQPTMDLIGEIVERETQEAVAPVATEPTGFPKPKKLGGPRKSRFKAAQKAEKPIAKEPESEAEKIHQENLDKLAAMTPEQIEAERQELLRGLDPKLVQSLLKRTEAREAKEHDHHHHAEGYNGWIGGVRTSQGLRELSHLDSGDIDRALGHSLGEMSLEPKIESEPKIEQEPIEPKEPKKDKDKSVRFDDVTTVRYDEADETGWEDVEDLNDLTGEAPEEYQLVHEDAEAIHEVHFTKPASETVEYGADLDINDPEFYDKLHEKYYPDLPKETAKLAWMTEPVPQRRDTTYESLSDMRFDFQGELVKLESDAPTYLGLHHHSENPHMPGYTLTELAHLARSVVPGQRCIAIQMLGRILFRLGSHKYSILPVPDDNSTEEDTAFDASVNELMGDFEKMMWDLVGQLRIVETLTEAADEAHTRNVSVRNYAIEALWLWRRGGGTPDSQPYDLSKIM